MKENGGLAVIGGGRWARITLNVLAKMQLSFQSITVVSYHNSEIIKKITAAYSHSSSILFQHVLDIDTLLKNHTVTAAIIANAADQHYATACKLLTQSIHLLIEKPVVATIEQMKNILAFAKIKNACVMPALVYRHCSYIHRFAQELDRFKYKKFYFRFEWSDSVNELRYGEIKTYDRTADYVTTVMPHVWTILSLIFTHQPMRITAANNNIFNLVLPNGQGEVILKDHATQRRRFIIVQDEENNILILDFSKEPGVIIANDETLIADPMWELKPDPLTQQINSFLSNFKTDSHACLGSVAFTVEANKIQNQTLSR